MDILEVMQVLPHRYPLLLVDRILEIELGKRIVGLKNVSINEPYLGSLSEDFSSFCEFLTRRVCIVL
jgi:3-hydroxymyristoyl/3-hydroxydecanoyl-(acyl carrier protein) dehydratase